MLFWTQNLVEFLAEVTGPKCKCNSTSQSSVVLESVRENAGSDFLLNIHEMVFTNYLPLLSRSEEECFHFYTEENLPSTAGAWQGVGRGLVGRQGQSCVWRTVKLLVGHIYLLFIFVNEIIKFCNIRMFGGYFHKEWLTPGRHSPVNTC